MPHFDRPTIEIIQVCSAIQQVRQNVRTEYKHTTKNNARRAYFRMQKTSNQTELNPHTCNGETHPLHVRVFVYMRCVCVCWSNSHLFSKQHIVHTKSVNENSNPSRPGSAGLYIYMQCYAIDSYFALVLQFKLVSTT